jgi:outer membrane protein assembly factor BamA
MWFSKAVLLFFCFCSLNGLAQKPFQLVFTNEDYKGFKRNPENFFKDSLSVVQYANALRFSAIEKGFLTASVDSAYFVDKKYFVDFHLGPKFGNVSLNMSSEDYQFFRRHMKISEKFLTNQKFRPKEIGRMMNDLHNCLLSNGYPFAKVTLENIEVSESRSIAFIKVDKYNKLNWSKIIIKGDTAVSSSYLYNLLQVKPGKPYDESQLKLITERINQVTFLTEIKPHEILFTPEGVELYLYVKSKPLSSINGFLGLQPDPVTSKYFLTGELALKLLNVLKKGELLDINWRNIQAQTQQLQARLNYPFLFKTSFGIDGEFKLYKRDSTFLDLKFKMALQYYLKGGNYVSFFYERNNSSLLSGAANNTSFSNLADVKTNNYGLAISRRKVDYFPNPTRGVNIQASFSFGQRQSKISDTSITVNNLIFKGESSIEYFIPLSSRNVLRLSNQSFTITAPSIFQNELIRFGGLLSQRGFNEDEIFASTVSIFSLEYRFLLDSNSRIFLFYDQSLYENTSLTYRQDNPFGFGAGLSFGTNIGIFSLQYALGSQQGNPILFKNGKIHFGYIAYF